MRNLENGNQTSARAIIGKESGDVVEVITPSGAKAYEITKVEWR